MPSSDDAVDAIYAAAANPSGWAEAAAAVGSLFDTATGSFYINRQTPQGLAVDVLSSFGHNQRSIDAYMDYFGTINPFDTHLGRTSVGEVITEAELVRRLRRPGIFETSEYYNDWVRPQNIRHVIGCYVDRSDGGTLCAAFYRPADGSDYSADETGMFARLMRHATRAVEIGVRLQTAKAEMAMLLDRSHLATITLGRNGAVRQRNAAADALFAAACGLTETRGRLRTALSQDQPGLDRLIACAFDPKRAAWAENTRLPIRRNDGGAPLTVRIVAARHRFGAFAPDRVAGAVLTVEGFETETLWCTERLLHRFALTPAQTRLALLLGKGRSLRAAASELGIGLQTARSHLKAVFARTDTHRQSELVLLLRDLGGR